MKTGSHFLTAFFRCGGESPLTVRVGVPPLSIRADNFLRVAVINNSFHNIKTYSWE